MAHNLNAKVEPNGRKGIKYEYAQIAFDMPKGWNVATFGMHRNAEIGEHNGRWTLTIRKPKEGRE